MHQTIRLGLIFVLATAAMAKADDSLMSRPCVRLVRSIAAPEHRTDIATCVTVVNGGAIVAGYTTDDSGNEDGLIVRVNNEGDVVWRRELTGEVGGKKNDDLWSIQPDGAGGFVAAGYSDKAGWLVRVNDAGDVSWQKTFG